MTEGLGEVSLYRMMLAALPATTDQLTRLNDRVHPDAILARLRSMQRFGQVSNIGGLWCVLRHAEDQEYHKQQFHKPRKPCVICGKPIRLDAKKYCSKECQGAGRTVVKNPCKLCGKPVKRNAYAYCSKECTDKARKTFPTKRTITKTCKRCGALVKRTINSYCGNFCYRMAGKGL